MLKNISKKLFKFSLLSSNFSILNRNIRIQSAKMAEKPRNSQNLGKESDRKDENNNEPDDFLIYLMRQLGIGGPKKPKDVSNLKKLETLDLNGIAKYLKTCKNIIYMSGAGISTSAGIPDFRSPKTGLYQNLEKYNLPYPEAIFSLDYFRNNPKPFFILSKELMPASYKPTVSHYFQRLLVEKGMVRKIYTQNIDALETIADIPDDKVINAHGSFKIGHCLSCRKEYSFEWMKKTIHEKEFLNCESEECLENKDKPDSLKIVKPDIVFFGEEMPKEFFNYRHDFAECDLLIVMGTSLKVQPFGSIINEVRDDCPRLLINNELVGDWADYEYEPDSNYRDVVIKGFCDEGCMKLAQELGWHKELENLIEKDGVRFEPKK